MTRPKSNCSACSLGTIGLLAGGLIGFLLRPSGLFGVQAPFGAVITRGASLRGLDQLLLPLAQQSFNYLLVGAIVGAAFGATVGYFAGHRE